MISLLQSSGWRVILGISILSIIGWTPAISPPVQARGNNGGLPQLREDVGELCDGCPNLQQQILDLKDSLLDIKLGLISEEPLRIIRGSVFADGRIERGAGFTVTKLGTGDFQINFNTPFSDFPMGLYSPICTGCTTSRIGGSPGGAFFHRVTFATQDNRVDPFAFHFIIIGPQ